MVGDYISFATARSSQARTLEVVVDLVRQQVLARQLRGELEGPGPIFVGIGASFAAACAPTWTMRQRGIHAWRLGAGDYPLPFPVTSHPVIGISQSGRALETLSVLNSIDPALRYAVTNVDPSPISAAATATLSLGNIPDSYASTIGYTATVVALGMIADAWDGGEIDPGWRRLVEEFTETEAAVGARATELAMSFVGASSADFVGSGPATGSAEAGALLFREVARLPSSAMSTRQYLHGAMESAGDGVHVLFGDRRELEVAHTLADAGHRVILVTSELVDEADRLQVVRLPALPAAQRAILEILVMQILVAEVAAIHNIDIEEFVFYNSDTKVDHPRPGAE